MRTKIYALLTVRSGSFRQTLFDLYRRSIASDFIRKVMETFATQVLQVCISLLTTVLVARALGPEGRGLYAVASAISAMGVQFGNLGLHASNTYYVAKNRELLPSLLGNTIAVSFVFGSFVIGLIWLIFSLWPTAQPVHGLLLIMALAWIPFGLAYMLMQNLLLGIHKVRAFNISEIVTKILGITLIGLIVMSGNVTAEKILLAGLITFFFTLPWMLWCLKPYIVSFPFPSFTVFKENIFYGLKAYLGAFFAFLVLRVDLLMVKHILGAQQAGYYSIAVTMTNMLFMLPVAIGTILFPKLSSLSTEPDKWILAKKVALLVGVMMVVIAGLATLLAAPLVRLLFGMAFLPVVIPFICLLPGIVMLSINSIYMNYFASMGMPLITVYSPAIAAIFNILLNLKIIPIFGVVGASIASTVSYGFMLIASIVYIFYAKRNVLS
ncbi:MAG: Membrane protein [Candidatus Jettenia ecosi]|uniref:Membrane protein n=1 Tax=Candidatus Jettenia ecosi TaxID=2494326 RepID=A0A533QMM0_9BACT|nr:MAG: Membrane protein [Candidatus Jettenia ecosi]